METDLLDHFNSLIHRGSYKKSAIIRKQILRWICEEESRIDALSEGDD